MFDLDDPLLFVGSSAGSGRLPPEQLGLWLRLASVDQSAELEQQAQPAQSSRPRWTPAAVVAQALVAAQAQAQARAEPTSASAEQAAAGASQAGRLIESPTELSGQLARPEAQPLALAQVGIEHRPVFARHLLEAHADQLERTEGPAVDDLGQGTQMEVDLG